MNFMFLIYDYFPNPSANTLCVQKLIERIQANGDNVTVVCIKSDLRSKSIEMINDVRVYRISGLFDTAYRFSRVLLYKHSRVFSFVGRLLIKLLKTLTRNEIEGYVSKWNIEKVLGVIIDEFNRTNQMTLITVSLPYITNAIALKAKKRISNLKWIVYELDPFTFNYSLDNRQLNTRKFLEMQVIKQADKIISTRGIIEENTRHGFRLESMEKQFYLDLPNLELFSVKHKEHNVQERFLSNFVPDKIHLVFTGFFYGPLRNPDFFLSILERMDDPNIVLHIFGTGCDNVLHEYRTKHPQSLFLYGRVNFETAQVALNRANILVNIGNNIPNQLPSKLFTYLGTGKPIINVVNGDYDLSRIYLEKYGLVKILNSSTPVDSNEIESLRLFCYSSSNLQLSPSDIIDRLNPFLTDNVAGKFINLIRS